MVVVVVIVVVRWHDEGHRSPVAVAKKWWQ